MAHVDGTVRAAVGSGLTGPSGVFVTSTSNDNLLGHASGNATADEVALAASAVIFRMNTNVDAYVGPQAKIDVVNPTANVPLNVEVSAQHNTLGLGVAGSFSGSQFVSAGAAFVATLATKSVTAHLDSAQVHAQNDVLVQASSDEDVDASAAGVGAGLALAVAGSAVFMQLNKHTTATIDGGTTLADGNVVLTATSHSTFDPISGAAGLGIGAGIGAAVNVFSKNDVTSATIQDGAHVDALALYAPASVFSGQVVNGLPQMELLQGVILRANSEEDLSPIAVAGALAAGFAGAASVNAVVLNNQTTAAITGASVVGQMSGAATNQIVSLLAWNTSNIGGLAGAAFRFRGRIRRRRR